MASVSMSSRLLPRNRRTTPKDADRQFVLVGTSTTHSIRTWDRAICVLMVEARHPLLTGSLVMTRRVVGRLHPYDVWSMAEVMGMDDRGRYVLAPIFDGDTHANLGEPIYVVRQIKRFLPH